MTKKFNPLLDSKADRELTMTASENNTIIASNGSVPLSPTTGKPMLKSHCRDVPVWVCPESRLVIPFKKEA